MAEGQFESLRDFFKCVICKDQLRDARLCPHCSKLTCYSCIQKWLTERRSRCPHCKNHLTLEAFVRCCRWTAEVTGEIDRLQQNGNVSSGETATAQDKCSLHNEKLSVYCSTCHECICYHCALWSGKHSGHALKPLQDEYRTQVEKVTSEVTNLRRRLAYLTNTVQQLEANDITVRKAKEETARQLQRAVELMIARLDVPMKNKIDAITGQKEVLVAEVEIVESVVHELEQALASLSQAQMVIRSSDILRSLGEVQRQYAAAPAAVSFDFFSEIIPQYDCHTMILQKFTELRGKGEPVFSTPLVVHGMIWRLKVYPDGNGVVKGVYLSVFLELINGPTEASKYEYRLEMVHVDGEPSRNSSREFTGDFDVAKFWGYARFFELDRLASEGFLNAANDSLTLRFQVRAPSYYQKCKDYLWHINQLEATCATQRAEMERMTHLHANSVNSGPIPSKQEVVGESSGQQKCVAV